jgi:hypothetical protein
MSGRLPDATTERNPASPDGVSRGSAAGEVGSGSDETAKKRS